MQVTCPQCETRLQLSAAKLPDTPFNINCPKCQHSFTVSPVSEKAVPVSPASIAESPRNDELQGSTGEPQQQTIAAPLPPPGPAPTAPLAAPEPPLKEVAPAATALPSTRPLQQGNLDDSNLAIGWTNSMPNPTVTTDANTLVGGHHHNYDLVQALTALLASGTKANPGTVLEQVRRRHIVVCLSNPEEIALLQRVLVANDYDFTLATSPEEVTAMLPASNQLDILLLDPNFHAEQQGGAVIMRNLNMLNPARRRRVFVVVTSHSYRTMDMQTAFVYGVNLVINSDDLELLPQALSKSIQDFNNLYRAFNMASGASAF